MILDCAYNTKIDKKTDLSFSYINADGSKSIKMFRDMPYFDRYVECPNGTVPNYNGKMCRKTTTYRPTKIELFDFKMRNTFLDEKSVDDNFPAIFAFDIETDIDGKSFPEPSEARMPVTCISICSDRFQSIVLGTRELSADEQKELDRKFKEYVEGNDYYIHEIKRKMTSRPECRYTQYETEEDMLRDFLKIVSRCPVLTGWNNIAFDWQYIVNRIKNNYPSLDIKLSSCIHKTENRALEDRDGTRKYLPFPCHTVIMDEMALVDGYDRMIEPKESLKLDYIGEKAVKANKITYKGSLKDLYNNDFARYIYYNSIDSALVQLIEAKLHVLQIMFNYSKLCRLVTLYQATSMIAVTEALFIEYFYRHGCVVSHKEPDNEMERGTFEGGYVRDPAKGMHSWLTCNDFASLYPSTIITCNLSVENIIYPPAPRVQWTDAELEKFRADKNYFVSLNGHVYKNDKDYSFKNIEAEFKQKRGIPKYRKMLLKTDLLNRINSILDKRGVKQ